MMHFDSFRKEKEWICTKKKSWPNINRLANEYSFVCFELEQNI